NWAQGVTVLEESPERGRLVRVESGMPMAKLGIRMSREGWQGLEWAVGIPGTVGGAIVSNAGAHGGTTAELVEKARVLTQERGVVELPAGALGFAYRSSNFLTAWRDDRRPAVTLSVDFRLRPA